MGLFGAEEKWLRSELLALIPSEGDIPLSANDTGAADIFRDMLEHLPALTGLSLHAAVVFVEFAGPLFGLKKTGRFSRLSEDQKIECLSALSSSRLYLARQMVMLLKMIACLGWGADPRVRRSLGYDRPPLYVKRDTESGHE
ncbi:MAG: hypothetical protein R6V10_00305 [bacterium]